MRALLSILVIVISVTQSCLAEHRKIAADLKNRAEKAIAEYTDKRFLNAVYEFSYHDIVLAKGANGFHNVEKKRQLEVGQTMPIASVTKTMTAASILKLQDAGKLDVNDPVSKHLTDLNLWKNQQIPAWAEQVTIHNLLTHTSGLREYFMAMPVNIKDSHKEINKAILNFGGAEKLLFTPGEKVRYTNTNFVILGIIIEQISGVEVAEYFKKELFEPLGMLETRMLGFDEAIEGQKKPEKAITPVRYFVTPTGKKPRINRAPSRYLMIPYADGGVISTTTDLIKWHEALHSGKVISEKSLKLMKTRHYKAKSKLGIENFMGYGMYISILDGGVEIFHHAGNALAIRCESGYIPSKGLYFAVLSNVMNFVPKALQSRVDYDDPINQLDVLYFTKAVLNSIK